MVGRPLAAFTRFSSLPGESAEHAIALAEELFDVCALGGAAAACDDLASHRLNRSSFMTVRSQRLEEPARGRRRRPEQVLLHDPRIDRAPRAARRRLRMPGVRVPGSDYARAENQNREGGRASLGAARAPLRSGELFRPRRRVVVRSRRRAAASLRHRCHQSRRFRNKYRRGHRTPTVKRLVRIRRATATAASPRSRATRAIQPKAAAPSRVEDGCPARPRPYVSENRATFCAVAVSTEGSLPATHRWFAVKSSSHAPLSLCPNGAIWGISSSFGLTTFRRQ